ncbi:site-specific integrase [Lactobacillus sp. ESL0791]|uniref:site-specific integrase n=1 Tax=Lactobacillus sp. ESL0791 TaxID=2983234 RepID=UPI0023F7048F|nr:site-specific integrase [Lactobacillus sp. ESL0791]MDF7638383.1 site-specific integrase [Lactobacillus sp. ESL0791]
MGENLSADTVNKNCAPYKACVKNAMTDEIITRDFTFGAQIIGNEAHTRKDKVKFLSLAEIKKLFAVALDNRSTNSTSTYMIITAILTGARISEIKALRWHNIHYDKHTIDIHHSYSEKLHQLMPTKNESSYRTIKVTQQLLDILDELKINKTDFVFENKRYQTIPLTGNVNNALKKLMIKANLSSPAFTVHSLRHCHVAMLLYQGVDIYAISQRLGHKNVNITLGVYAYMIEELKNKNDKEVEDKINDLFSK